MSIAENKERQVSWGFNAPPFKHNVLYGCNLHDSDSTNPLSPTNIAQGANGDQRNGKEIYSVGFRIRGVFAVPFDRRNVKVKIWLVDRNENQGNPGLYGEWYLPGGSGNGMLDSLDTHRWHGVKLVRTLRVKARDLYSWPILLDGTNTGEDEGADASIYYDIWIPFRRKMEFRSSANTSPFVVGGKERLTLMMLAYDTPSTAETDDVITSHEQQVTFYYRDP